MPSRRLIVWLLALALGVQGWAAVTVHMLGSAHRHTAVAASDPAGVRSLAARVAEGFRDIRLWRAELRERLGLDNLAHVHADGTAHAHEDTAAKAEPPPAAMAAVAKHPHTHPAYQRHHHALGDPTVLAIDSAAVEDSSSPGTGVSVLSAAQIPPDMADGFSVPSAVDAPGRWLSPSQARWTDALVNPLERPPSA